jgi:hypothetical protein
MNSFSNEQDDFLNKFGKTVIDDLAKEKDFTIELLKNKFYSNLFNPVLYTIFHYAKENLNIIDKLIRNLLTFKNELE